MLRKHLLFLVAGVAVFALVAPASASVVAFTDTAQLDYSDQSIQTGMAGWPWQPVGGQAVEVGSGWAGTMIRGINWRNYEPAYGYNIDGFSIDGVVAASQFYPQFNSGLTGTDSANASVCVGSVYWGGTYNFTTVAGQAYKIQMMGVDMNAATNFTVTVPGKAADVVTGAQGVGFLYTQTFVATGTTSSIAVSSTGPIGAAILSPTIIPEPATMSLLALGALGALIRRRRTA